MNTQESKSPPRAMSSVAIILFAIILIGFLMAIAGFFMTWMEEYTTETSDRLLQVTWPVMTGKNAGPYGYVTLGLLDSCVFISCSYY